jgi:outer membrane protein assembly factor BamE (lipoprotein component of BamABCDE complex)
MGDRVRKPLAAPRSLARRFSPCLLSMMLVLLVASGCAVSRGDLGNYFNGADISAIKKGVATQAEVVRLLGAPDNVIQLRDREVFHYYHYTLKHATFLVFSRVNIASDELYVFFDRRGIVDQVLFGPRTDKLEFQFWPFGD